MWFSCSHFPPGPGAVSSVGPAAPLPTRLVPRSLSAWKPEKPAGSCAGCPGDARGNLPPCPCAKAGPAPDTHIQPDAAPGVKSGSRVPDPQTPARTRVGGNSPKARPEPLGLALQGRAHGPLSRPSPGSSQLFSRSRAPKDVLWAGLAVPTLLRTLNPHVGRQQCEGRGSSPLSLISPNIAPAPPGAGSPLPRAPPLLAPPALPLPR